MPPLGQPEKYKGAINCGSKDYKCISNADLSWENKLNNRMRLGLEALVGIIDDMNLRCSFWDTKCKKNMKLLEKKFEDLENPKP